MNLEGLTSLEVIESRKKEGSNKLSEAKRPSFLRLFCSEFKDTLVIILLITAFVSYLIDKNNLLESLIIAGVLIVNALIGAILENKAFKSLDSLKKLATHKAIVYRDNEFLTINASELVVGDLVKISKGELINADLILEEGNNLLVDESIISGESNAINKKINDELFSGSFVLKGSGYGRVIRVGKKTTMGKIAKDLTRIKAKLTPLEEKLKEIGSSLGIIAILICALIFILERLNHIPYLEAFKSAVSLAVASIPEGLASVVTVTLALGVKRMARENVIIKKIEAVETLGAASVICTDKTGTLTLNQQIIRSIYDKTLMKIDHYQGQLLEIASILANPQNESVSLITDPIDKAILKSEPERKKFLLLEETPFDSTLKYSMIVIKKDEKIETYYKGASDVLAKKLKIKMPFLMQEAYQAELKKGYRIISFTTEDAFLGFIAFSDELRPGVKETIKEAQMAHLKTVMITGDYKDTAYEIGSELGLVQDINEVIGKEEFDKLSDIDIPKYSIFSRVTPHDKERIIRSFKAQGHIVAMIGDGINDSISLKEADIGCAMGNGADISKDSSDLILVDSNYKTMIKAIKEGRGIYQNIQKCVKYLLSSNIGEVLTLFLVSLLSLICKTSFGIPLLPVHLLWINIITDSLPAFGLGVEETHHDIMLKAPRKKKENFFTHSIIQEILFYGLIIGLTTVISYFIGLKYAPELAQTMAFVTLSTSQLFHSYNCKEEKSIFNKNIFKNRLLNISFLIGIGLEALIIYSNKLNEVFKVVKLPLNYLLISLLLASFVLFVSEINRFFKAKQRQ